MLKPCGEKARFSSAHRFDRLLLHVEGLGVGEFFEVGLVRFRRDQHVAVGVGEEVDDDDAVLGRPED